jgi:hypothetical protein
MLISHREKAIFTIKSVNEKRDEISVYHNKIVVNIKFRFWMSLRPIIILCLFWFICSVIFKKYIGYERTRMYFFYYIGVIGSLVIAKGFIFRIYLIDFTKKKIYMMFWATIRFPILSFSEIGGIDRVLVSASDPDRFFYKIWKRGHQYEKGIPLTDIRHTSDSSFEVFIKNEFLPFMMFKLNLVHKDTRISDDNWALQNNIKYGEGDISNYRFCNSEAGIYFKHGFNLNLCFLIILFVIPFSLLIIGLAKWFSICIFSLLIYLNRREIFSPKFYIVKNKNSIYIKLNRENCAYSFSDIRGITIETMYGNDIGQHVVVRLIVEDKRIIKWIDLEYFGVGEVYKIYKFVDGLKFYLAPSLKVVVADNYLDF